jgi:hypothetical protein
MARIWIIGQHLLRLRCQYVEALPHIRNASGKPARVLLRTEIMPSALH